MSISGNFPSTRPSLLLDFANVGRLDPRVTFARASTARYYDGVTTAKAEQNLLTYSQEFDNAAWVKTASSVTANTETAPDGTSTADVLVEDATTSEHNVNRGSTALSGVTYTVSVFAKQGSGTRKLGFRGFGAGGAGAYPVFNLTTGAIDQAGTGWSNQTITSVGNGWYRCSATVTSSSTLGLILNILDDTTVSYAGDSTSSIFLWGAQLEQRSAVTAYTATTTQPITNYVPVLLAAQNNEARFDHNPTTGAALGLEIEEQRTNLLLRSEDFSTTWTKTRSSITANTIVAPDGTLTGDKLVEDTTASDTHFVNQSVVVVNPNQYTVSVFLKAAERNIVDFITASGTATFSAISINLTNGTIGAPITTGLPSAVSTSTINFVGNGWYRVTMQFVGSSTGFSGCQVRLSDGSSTTYTGDGYSGVYIWGAQLEAGAFATSYIPTTTTALTRNADVATMTGTNFSSWYNASEGVLYSQSQQYADRTGGFPVVTGVTDSGDGQNCIEHYWGNSTSSFGGIVYVSAAIQAALSTSGLTRTAVQKYAFAYKANDFASSLNGAAVSTDGSGTIPVVDRLVIGGRPTGGRYSGYIQRIAYYPTRLPDAQLQALTG